MDDQTRAAEEALAATTPLRNLADEVRSYPLRLLRLVAEQHAARNAPVPDHALRLPPYLGETALRGLLEGGFIKRVDGARGAIHAYAPTEAGLALLAPPREAAPSAKKPRKPPAKSRLSGGRPAPS